MCKYFLYLFLFTSILSCQSNKHTDKDITGEPSTYEYINDSIQQTLHIEPVNADTIRFTYSLSRYRGDTGLVIGGIAKGNHMADPETDEDEQGNAYPAMQYTYQDGNCLLAIRQRTDTNTMARVIAVDCGQKYPAHDLNSISVLRKKKE